MKKILFFAAVMGVAFTSCMNEEFIGDNSPTTSQGTPGAINFNMSMPAVTRATETGSTAAGRLNKNFVVLGYKGGSQIVFDNYQANYVDASGSSAGSTESNSAGWEYVSYKNLPFGTKMATGDALNDRGVAANATGSTTNIIQSIKYWDYNAGTYDFFAYSLGAGEADTDGDADSDNQYAKATALALTGYGDSDTHPGYQLTGSQSQLGMCYISKQKHIVPSSSSPTEVDLEFVNFLSKVQLKFFETIPGYSVKDLKFYIADNTKSYGASSGDGLAPALYTASTIPTGGTYEITFDSNYDPVVTLESASSTSTSISFDEISSGVWLTYTGKDYEEASGDIYLGRTSSAATPTSQISVLPNSTGATLTLMMDYTLVSIDKTGESIEVSKATATVPADFTKWKPNYAYTYIFKITDDKLVPITLDAIITTSVDGSQTTITTVEPISITTYQAGAIANEYNAGNIYITVGDGSTTLYATGGSINAKLYTATIQAGAAQGIATDGSVAITEEMVRNALTKTPDGSGHYVLTDANSKALTVIPVAADASDKLVGELTAIPAADAPGGKELAIKCAEFAAVNNKVYVFEYIQNYTTAEVNAYNASLTGALGTTALTAEQATAYNTAMSASKNAGDTLSADEANAYNITLTGHITTSDTHKHYKVIKVGAPTPES